MFLIILGNMKIFEELSKLSPEKVEFVQDGFIYSEEWKVVKELSEKVYSFISNPNTKRKIDMINQPGKSSHDIQKIITSEMIKLGFTGEKQGLFLKYKNSGIRPDFYKKIKNTGIIFEVERGKTNINNMDFLDFWKCHICSEVNYLFLFVPKLLFQNTKVNPSKPFQVTCSHISSFFEPENYTNVRGVVLFGY